MVSIRPIQESDLKRLTEIVWQITGEKGKGMYWEEGLEELMKRGERENMLVAEMGGQAVGFIIGEVRTQEFGVREGIGWIKMLGIDPEWQGRGYGKLLGEALIKNFQIRGVKRVRTQVQWDAGDLIAYFRDLAFERSRFIVLEREL